MEFANLDEEYKKCEELKKEDVKIIQEWMDKQQHLPKISELKLIIFLHSCHYKIEPTKACIENYYTIRSKCPELFSKRSFQNVRKTLDTILYTYLPKQTPDGCNIFLAKILDVNPDNYSFLDGVKALDMAVNLHQMKVGTSEGEVIIFDTQGPTFAHLLKINITVLKTYMYFLQEALPVRIKAIHITNASALADRFISMAKPFIKNELMNCIHVHQTMESLYEYLPKEVLPNEYGGCSGTFAEFQKKTLKIFEENNEFFIQDEKETCDESKRQGKTSNFDQNFGTDGTFKKLQID